MRPAARLARIGSSGRPLPPLPASRPASQASAAGRDLVPVAAARRSRVAAGSAAARERRSPSGAPQRRRLGPKQRPPLRLWPLALGVAVALVVVALAGFGLRRLIADVPPLLAAHGLPRIASVPLAIAPVWAAVFVLVRLTLGFDRSAA